MQCAMLQLTTEVSAYDVFKENQTAKHLRHERWLQKVHTNHQLQFDDQLVRPHLWYHTLCNLSAVIMITERLLTFANMSSGIFNSGISVDI